MHIRKASDTDNEQIIDILKLSLGEHSSPKRLNVWEWKHIQNPFGSSEVLVAETEGALVGVRAMMPWKWQIGNVQMTTYRAVDTAIHPDHQGKGLFTKLTLKMLNLLKEEGSAFVFNTPNKQSLPGYLKMGWMKWGRVAIHFFPVLSFKKSGILLPPDHPDLSITGDLCEEWNQLLQASGQLFTPKSPAYLSWRYIENPILNYRLHVEKDIFIAAYVKKRRGFNELRICEIITLLNPEFIQRKLMAFIKMLIAHNKVHIVTLSKDYAHIAGIPGLSLPVGPLLTIRKLNEHTEIPVLSDWAPAIGDLELF